jgi:DNA-directed RNA polymerase specialized sigma24 family protein
MGYAEAKHPEGLQALPEWISDTLLVYLAHTEGGQSIRALARAAGCHPSTTLRQVQRIEALRDDPLADAGLGRLGQLWRQRSGSSFGRPRERECSVMISNAMDDVQISQETFQALKAMNGPDCLMVIADGVEEAVVVHSAEDGRPVRRAVVSREIAETLVLRDFVEGRQTGRLTRYTITAAGRSELRRLLAEVESARAALHGVREDQAVVDARQVFEAQTRKKGRKSPRRRGAGTETPIYVLARRRRADGEPWLPPDLVAAAFRFHETYEIARLGGAITHDWERLKVGRINGSGPALPAGRATRRLEAEESLAAAIRALGPDLTETVILSVCHEEGMEEIESRLGYPARSGKLVLRIALRRLARHYAEEGSEKFDMIY